MSLLNPTVGDLCDRLTILALKRLHGTAAGKDVSHFQREWAGLLTKVQGRQLNAAWFEHLLDLAAVNAQLWTLTDQLRKDAPLMATNLDGVPNLTLVDVAVCGVAILKANDRRAALIQTIDQLCGDFAGAEKL